MTKGDAEMLKSWPHPHPRGHLYSRDACCVEKGRSWVMFYNCSSSHSHRSVDTPVSWTCRGFFLCSVWTLDSLDWPQFAVLFSLFPCYILLRKLCFYDRIISVYLIETRENIQFCFIQPTSGNHHIFCAFKPSHQSLGVFLLSLSVWWSHATLSGHSSA